MNRAPVDSPGDWSTEVVRTEAGTGLLGSGDLRVVLDHLRTGWPVGLPTETVYGLAAPALDEAACARIFAAKERPWTDPLICHVGNVEWMDRLAVGNDLARRLAEAFWPGPLTLVLPKKALVPDLVTSGQSTVALRQPRHPVFLQVLRALDAPLAAPSANRFGCVSPTNAAHVLDELGGRIPAVVDGGPCGVGLESTIVLVEENSMQILREGPILPEELSVFAPVREASARCAEKDGPVVPGGLPWHYAPRTKLHLCRKHSTAPPSARAGLLSWRGTDRAGWERIEVLSATGDLREAARRFYAALRSLDEARLEAIWAEMLPDEGLGKTLNERLRKAAARE
jgi:L-threonylcarbamoyladenylate synthase